MTYPVRRVTWLAACGLNGPAMLDHLPQPTVFQTVGLLLQESHQHITLARDIDDEGIAVGVIAIPRLCIESMDDLTAFHDRRTDG